MGLGLSADLQYLHYYYYHIIGNCCAINFHSIIMKAQLKSVIRKLQCLFPLLSMHFYLACLRGLLHTTFSLINFPHCHTFPNLRQYSNKMYEFTA